MITYFFDKYYLLRDGIDFESQKLSILYQKQIVCKKGCDSCCENISIFPVEFYAISNELKNRKDLPEEKFWYKFTNRCKFLKNGECMIYKSRPLICRTQGLPLLYENSNGTDFELSVCKLNFKTFDFSKFNIDNSLYMSPYNSKLFLLNKEFIEKEFNNKYKSTDRININKL